MSTKIACSYCGKLYSSKGLGTHVWRTHGDGKDFIPNTTHNPPWNKGLTKESSQKVAQAADRLRRVKSKLELEVNDDNKLKQRWANKRVNANAEGIPFDLSYAEYVQLVADAGLKSSQLGFTGDGYVLARYNDSGGYSINNCRFITQKENISERKITDKMRASGRTAITNYNKNRSSLKIS